MTKNNYILFLIPLLLGFMNYSYSFTANSPLIDARAKVIKQYITDLNNADYKDIVQLFEKDGYVISTSRGKTDAKEFFYAFLPDLASAQTEFKHIFNSNPENNSIAARFHFTFKMKDGSAGDGEYIDEFVFNPQSAKLAAVFMFENLKF